MQSQPRLASFTQSWSLSLRGVSLDSRSGAEAPSLRRIGGDGAAMPSRSSPSRLPGAMATIVGGAMLQLERSAILRRHEASASVACFTSSSSLSLTAETLQLKGSPQDWSLRRWARMRQLPPLMPLAVQQMSSL